MIGDSQPYAISTLLCLLAHVCYPRVVLQKTAIGVVAWGQGSFYQLLLAGVVADLQHAYPPRLEYGRDPLPLHEDSAWDSNDSEPAWNASASSVVSTSIAESKTSCDTHTHSGNGSLANGCSVGPAEIDDVNMTCLNSRKQHEQGKESRVSKFLHWLADPDNTDAKAVKADRGYY